MGLYDTLHLDDEIALPGFDGDPQSVEWQSKTIGCPRLREFRLTADGRLLRKEQSYRDLSPEECDEKARERGFDSWADWEATDTPEPLPNWKRTVDEEWWVDHHQHGTFEFHGSTADNRYSYEARFTKGSLDEIVLLDVTEQRPMES